MTPNCRSHVCSSLASRDPCQGRISEERRPSVSQQGGTGAHLTGVFTPLRQREVLSHQEKIVMMRWSLRARSRLKKFRAESICRPRKIFAGRDDHCPVRAWGVCVLYGNQAKPVPADANSTPGSDRPGYTNSAFRNFFPKLCLILKEWFLTGFPPNFQDRFLMSSASP